MSSIAFMSSFFLELVTLIHQLLQLVDFRFIVLPGLTDDLLLFLNPFPGLTDDLLLFLNPFIADINFAEINAGGGGGQLCLWL